MNWYLKTRRVYWLFGFGLLVSVLTLLFASRALPVPNFAGGGASGVPAAFMIPAAGAAALLASLADSGLGSEKAAVRQVQWMDRALVLAYVGAIAALLLVVGLTQHEPLLICAVRNLLGYIGLGLIARPLLGPLAVSGIPIIAALLVGAFGQRHEHWLLFWPLNSSTSLGSWAIALLLFGTGQLLLARRSMTR